MFQNKSSLVLKRKTVKEFQRINQSTTVEQAVACAFVTQRTRVGSLIWPSFLSEFFSGFFLTCKTNVKGAVGSQDPRISFGRYNHNFIIRLVRINGCVNGVYRLSCSRCLGSGPGIELIPHPGKASMPFWSKKYVCDPKLIPSSDRSLLCKDRVA